MMYDVVELVRCWLPIWNNYIVYFLVLGIVVFALSLIRNLSFWR